jgi:hypothetical protein
LRIDFVAFKETTQAPYGDEGGAKEVSPRCWKATIRPNGQHEQRHTQD